MFGGQSDFLISGLSVGSAGCIAAFANVFPKVVMQIYNLWQQGKTQEALKLHQQAALAERACKGGIAGTKYAAALTSAKTAGIAGNAMWKKYPRQMLRSRCISTDFPVRDVREVRKAIVGSSDPGARIERLLRSRCSLLSVAQQAGSRPARP